MSPSPLAFLITFTTYGSWLHGSQKGSADRVNNQFGMPLLSSNQKRESIRKIQMSHGPYKLDEASRKIVLNTIREVALYRKWNLIAAHVRTNHAHLVIQASVSPEKILIDMKAWCSKQLNIANPEEGNRPRWTRHGSTRYLWNEQSVQNAVVYVLEEQGEQLSAFDGRVDSENTEAGFSEADA